MMTLRFLDDCLAEACMMRAAHRYLAFFRGVEHRPRRLALVRAELWADHLGAADAPVVWTWDRMMTVSKVEWEAR